MEENKLVSKENDDIVFDDEIYGVRIEKSNRRQKSRRTFKQLMIFTFIACILFIFVYNFKSISNFFSSLSNSRMDDNVAPIDSSEENDIQNDLESQNKQEETMVHDFNFIDTAPRKFEIFLEDPYAIDIEQLSFNLPNSAAIYNLYGDNAPVVLIVNMSPQECYSDGYGYSYSSDFYSNEKNVSYLGEQICENLSSMGINAIHLKTDIEATSLSQYQQKYAKEIAEVIERYPSISCIFDVSRALTINSDMSINREQIELNGNKVPTIRFICGTSNSITEEQEKSIYLAHKLAKNINNTAPLLVSGLDVSRLDLNLSFKIPCIRIDIGSYANTFEEASLTADYFSIAICNFFQ